MRGATQGQTRPFFPKYSLKGIPELLPLSCCVLVGCLQFSLHAKETRLESQAQLAISEQGIIGSFLLPNVLALELYKQLHAIGHATHKLFRMWVSSNTLQNMVLKLGISVRRLLLLP